MLWKHEWMKFFIDLRPYFLFSTFYSILFYSFYFSASYGRILSRRVPLMFFFSSLAFSFAFRGFVYTRPTLRGTALHGTMYDRGVP